MTVPTFVLIIGEEQPMDIPAVISCLPRPGESIHLPEISEDNLIIREIAHEIHLKPSRHIVRCYVERE